MDDERMYSAAFAHSEMTYNDAWAEAFPGLVPCYRQRSRPAYVGGVMLLDGEMLCSRCAAVIVRPPVIARRSWRHLGGESLSRAELLRRYLGDPVEGADARFDIATAKMILTTVATLEEQRAKLPRIEMTSDFSVDELPRGFNLGDDKGAGK